MEFDRHFGQILNEREAYRYINYPGVVSEYMRVTRRTLAKALLVAFVFNLIVMGAGAYFAYQQSPE